MRLFAAARLSASDILRKRSSARRRKSMSSDRLGLARQHGVEHFGGDRAAAFAFQIRAAQALDHVRPDFLGNRGRLFDRLRRDGCFRSSWRRSRSSCRSRIVRSTPSAARRRPNGSRVPLGFWPIAKMPASVSSLSASASAMPVRVSGSAIAGEARPVLFVDALRRLRRARRRLRVVPAHESLQLGEFADHRRQQVALAELAPRAARARGIARRSRSAIRPRA